MKAKTKAKPSLSLRERMLLLILPAALILVLYSFLFNAAHLATLTKVKQQLTLARQRTGGAPVENRTLASTLGSLKTERETLRHKLDAFEMDGGDGLQRSEALVQIVELLQANHLTIIEEGPSANASAAAPAPTVRAIAGKSPQARPETIWQIRFLGSWDSVQTALQVMPAAPGITCLPVSLSMAEPQDTSSLREWTLRLRL